MCAEKQKLQWGSSGAVPSLKQPEGSLMGPGGLEVAVVKQWGCPYLSAG